MVAEEGSGIVLPGGRLAVKLGLCIPVFVAVTNYVMVVLDLNLITYKFHFMQVILGDDGLIVAWPYLVGACGLLGLMVGAAVVGIAPVCVGSGIPEVLSYLNGNASPGLFTKVSFTVRVLGVVLAQSAGYPIGREGPMVGIGGCIGYGVATYFVSQFEREADQAARRKGLAAGASSEQVSATSSWYMALEEKITSLKRMGCAIGGAAGIATAFNAPIGGVLYMMEEMAVSSLTPELPKFMCTVIASIFARLLLNITHMDVHKLVIYSSENQNTLAWNWPDIPVFVGLAAFLGSCGAVFSTVLLTVWSARKRFYARKVNRRWVPWVKVFECAGYAMLCSTAWALFPHFFPCMDEPSSSGASGASGAHRRLSESATMTQYACEEGQYNELATVLLNSAEGAVKHLYSRNMSVLGTGPLFVALVVYGILAAGMPGLAVPMGTFVPNMLIGALIGRICGEQIQGLFGFEFAPAGIYAAVGSAAMLAGFTHMTLGIVALLAEAINDFGVVAPLMLGTFIAHAASKKFSHHGYDEQLIIRKGVAFLDSELPHELEGPKLTAITVAHHLHPECRLTARAMVGDIKKALRHKDVDYFPLVGDNGDTCIGLTSRGRLKAVLSAVKENRSSGTSYLTRIRNSFRGGRRPSKESVGSDRSQNSWQSSGSACSPTPPLMQDSNDEFRGVMVDDSPAVERSERRLNTQTSTCSGQTTSSSFSSCSSTALKLWRRATEGTFTDVATEIRMHGFFKAVFTKVADPENEEEFFQPHVDDHNRLDMTLITDPVPFILYEDTPVSRFYPIFKVGAPVAMVVSRSGRFSGIVSRRGLIEAAARLHKGEAVNENGNRAPTVTLGVNRTAEFACPSQPASSAEETYGSVSMQESSGAESIPHGESLPQRPIATSRSQAVTQQQNIQQLKSGGSLQCTGFRRQRTPEVGNTPLIVPPLAAINAQSMFPYIEHMSRATLELQLMQVWTELAHLQDNEISLAEKLHIFAKMHPPAEETGTTGALNMQPVDQAFSSNATSRQTSQLTDVDALIAEHMQNQKQHSQGRQLFSQAGQTRNAQHTQLPAAEPLQQQRQLPPHQGEQQQQQTEQQQKPRAEGTPRSTRGPEPTTLGIMLGGNEIVEA